MSIAEPETYGGYETTAMFAFEQEFATQLTTPNYNPFGLNTNVSTKSFDNNLEDDYEPNARTSSGKTAMEFTGDITVEFTATNPKWVPGAIDEGSTTGTEAPYTHTYSGVVSRPMEIVHGLEPDAQETRVSGVVFTSASVSGNETGRVTVSLSGSYAKEEEVQNFTSQPAVELEPLVFKHGTVTYNGTNFEILQEWDFEIENNSELVFEQGDRFARTYRFTGPRETTLTTNYLRINDDVKELAYGSSGSTTPQQDVEDNHTIEVVLDNGETNANTQTETWTFTGCAPSSHDRSGIANQEDSVTDEVQWNVDDVELVAENSLENAQ